MTETDKIKKDVNAPEKNRGFVMNQRKNGVEATG